jgi:hypothetical protein
MAVFYGLFIGFFVYRTLTLRDVYEMLVEAGELSALILIRCRACFGLRLGDIDHRRGAADRDDRSSASGSANTAPSRC